MTNPSLFLRNLRAIDLIRNVYRENGIGGFYKGKRLMFYSNKKCLSENLFRYFRIVCWRV